MKVKALLEIPKEILKSRKLIWSLAKNDFKTRFVGSYLGVFWAFVNPVVMIVLYWFVFQFAFHSSAVDGHPYVLWFTTGLVPWFMFQEGFVSGTNALKEYAYLVKKVVFKVSILPTVKIVSSTFVHVVFMGMVLVIAIFMGYYPSLYTLQLVYYFICMVVYIMALVYTTSAILLFFQDLGQFINVFMQVFMWMTPIMWNYTIIPEAYRWIIKLNPMFYIVSGYRDSVMYHIGLWERPVYLVCFWALIAVLFTIGMFIFRRLRPHFADVL